jgi:hypothetical protein
MTEQDYIDVTNLTKLRTMQTILRDVLAMRQDEESIQKDIGIPLAKWIDRLEKSGPRISG